MICKTDMTCTSLPTSRHAITNQDRQLYCRPVVHRSTPGRDQTSVMNSKVASNEIQEMSIGRGSHPASPVSTAGLPGAYSPVSTRTAPTLIQHSAEYPSDMERQRDINEEQSGAEISFAARGKGDPRSGIPFYTGR